MLQAGSGTRDITPKGSVFLVGYPHVPRMSEGVHDPLQAQAMVLRSNGGGVVLMSLDLLFLSPQTARRFRTVAAAAAGVDQDCVLIGCTHTHSGPVTDTMLSWEDDPVVGEPAAGYMAELERAVEEAAGEAAENMVEAEIAWTAADVTGVGSNRHDPAGTADPEVGILVVREGVSNQPVGVLMVYSMHPTVLHEDSRLVSADFPGAAREYLRRNLGEGCAVVYLTGPSGNQSPRHTTTGNTFAESDRLGALLGRFVLDAMGTATAFDGDPVLGGKIRNVDLPRRSMGSLPDAEVHLGRVRERYESLRTGGAAAADVRTAECAVFGAEELVVLARSEQSGELDQVTAAHSPAEVQVLRVGEAHVVGLPGELFVEYGLEIKRRLPGPGYVATLVNGEVQGYIVTPEAAESGEYEANCAVFSPEAGTRMVDAAVDLAREL